MPTPHTPASSPSLPVAPVLATFPAADAPRLFLAQVRMAGRAPFEGVLAAADLADAEVRLQAWLRAEGDLEALAADGGIVVGFKLTAADSATRGDAVPLAEAGRGCGCWLFDDTGCLAATERGERQWAAMA